METTVNVDNFGTNPLTDEQTAALLEKMAAEDRLIYQTDEDLGEPAAEEAPWSNQLPM